MKFRKCIDCKHYHSGNTYMCNICGVDKSLVKATLPGMLSVAENLSANMFKRRDNENRISEPS